MTSPDLRTRPLPFFSIVIPTYRRPQKLAECLQSLTCLEYPPDHFEVIVVDDGSPVLPDAMVASFRNRLDVTLVARSHAGPAAARNAGAQRAKGHYLAFTDDDCRPAPDWLTALANRFAHESDCAIGGHTLNALPGNSYSTASQLLVDYLYDYYNAVPDRARFLASNNISVPAQRFREVGGFDTNFPLAAAEDREFCHRWLRLGYGMIYAPEVVVHHAHSLTPRAFLRQHRNYGRGAWQFHKLCARYNGETIRVEPLSFYLSLVRYPYVYESGLKAAELSVLLATAQIANVLGFAEQQARVRIGIAPPG